jgi:hypothetical protein
MSDMLDISSSIFDILNNYKSYSSDCISFLVFLQLMYNNPKKRIFHIREEMIKVIN